MEILTRDTPASQAQSIETSSYWSLPILSSFMAESWRRPLRLVSVFLEQYLLDAMPAHGNDCDFVSLAPEGIALLRNFAEHMGDPSVHAVEKKAKPPKSVNKEKIVMCAYLRRSVLRNIKITFCHNVDYLWQKVIFMELRLRVQENSCRHSPQHEE